MLPCEEDTVLYHYTPVAAAQTIRRQGVIRTAPVVVYATLEGPLTGEKPTELGPPVIWLTINPILDLAVVVRECLHGFQLDRPGGLWRFGVDDEVAPLSLPEWAEKHGHAPELFFHMVRTGKMAGSDYTCWRLAERDVVRADWKVVESWDGKGGWRAESFTSGG